MNEPIVISLLDLDFYKISMGQWVFHRYPDVLVRYAFRCRTPGIPLAEIIAEKELRQELDHVRTLRFNNSELHYLRGTNEYEERMFKEAYLEFLKDLRMPSYELERVGDTYCLEFPGKWSEAIYWETIALAIVNELYYRALMVRLGSFERDVVHANGVIRLCEKLKTLRDHGRVMFSDFGTRRRFSKAWHDYVVRTLSEELPRTQFIGTSNVYLAMKYGLMPIGTSAHELFMIRAGMCETDEEIRKSQLGVVDEWWDEYHWGLSIFLPDTYGSDWFLQNVMTEERARTWKGTRQDSGDPIEFGEKLIAHYEHLGIDPRDKLLIPSDGLDVGAMTHITDYFAGRIRVSCGWGTNLTNDLGLQPLSLIIKPVEVLGRKLVKLSDNVAKATSGSAEEIERYKKIFGYTSTFEQRPLY